MANIGFRADGGQGVGMGHVIRCLALADEFRKMGHKVFFFSRLQQGIERISREGFEVIRLNSDTADDITLDNLLLDEEKELTRIIEQIHIDYLIIDSYKVNEKYLLNLKKRVKKLTYIDDVNKFSYPADILVNYNKNAQELGYDNLPEYQLKLLGSDYALIRKQFQNISPRQINREISEIMITSGGSDPYGICRLILDIVLNTEGVKDKKINVIIGSGLEIKKKIEEVIVNKPNVELYYNIEDISDIMLKSDIAISSGGSTLYELSACGTPTIAYIMADNQEGLVNCMQGDGYIESLGWYNRFTEKDLRSKILSLAGDFNRRKELSSKMQSLVDGKGAQRIAEAIAPFPLSPFPHIKGKEEK